MIKIKSVKISDISINPAESGKGRIRGNYSLMSETDRVLAKQSFNSYGDLEVTFSSDTIKAMDALYAALQVDINSMIGIGGE